jgi:hypothetical protein
MDWVVPADTDVQATRDPRLRNGPLNAFDYNANASSGFTVRINTGEAFVGGHYAASDDGTIEETNPNTGATEPVHEIELASETANQTVYLGVDHQRKDRLIIGLDSAFTSASDPRIPIWRFDTDALGVADGGVTDLRPLSRRLDGTIDSADTATRAQTAQSLTDSARQAIIDDAAAQQRDEKVTSFKHYDPDTDWTWRHAPANTYDVYFIELYLEDQYNDGTASACQLQINDRTDKTYGQTDISRTGVSSQSDQTYLSIGHVTNNGLAYHRYVVMWPEQVGPVNYSDPRISSVWSAGGNNYIASGGMGSSKTTEIDSLSFVADLGLTGWMRVDGRQITS